MSGESVLIVEDDPTMLRVLTDRFRHEGYTVHSADDGEQGLRKAVDGRPELIVLDIMLPKINGYEICRLIREQELEMPIIMLTAKGQESDVVLGLNLGADDYVTKPFSMKELLARSRAMLRRRRQQVPKIHAFGEFELHTDSRKLLRNGNTVKLTPKEFDLLALFLDRAGRALTRDRILSAVWGSNAWVSSRSVDRCVTMLRKKIECDSHRPRYIQTVRDVGYRFEIQDDDAIAFTET